MHSNQCFLPVHHCEEGLSRYGHLYDVDVQVFPTSESVIVDVLNEPTSRLVAIPHCFGSFDKTGVLTTISQIAWPRFQFAHARPSLYQRFTVSPYQRGST